MSDTETETNPAPFWTLAIYLIDRAYGGPEEGGWWYQTGERQDAELPGVLPQFLLTVWSTEENAENACKSLQELLDETVNVGRREISSVLSTGRYQAEVYNGHPPARYRKGRTMSKLVTGDRVAYTAAFLKASGQHTGYPPQRRGTFAGYWSSDPNIARVKWDDFEERAAFLAEQYGADYVADAREHGQLVHAKNIAKVGSARFALTCAT